MNASSRQILVVEDSRTQAEQLRYLLEQSGYAVTVAADGGLALEAARTHPPDLVVSDILMPVMDGYALCRALKDDPRLRDTPVILLTTLSDPGDVVLGIQAGVDYYLTKPYEREALLLTVEGALREKSRRAPEDTEEEFQVTIGEQTPTIRSSRKRLMSLLLSTYDSAVRRNRELGAAQKELERLNQDLERLVDDRTAALRQEVEVRRQAEQELERKNEEIRSMTQHLWQAAKLATMGELAASIAHELNNPLATVALRVESLLAQLSKDDPRRQALDIVEREIERMGRLVADLLQFSRRSQPQISTVDVGEEIDRSLDLVLFHLRKSGIEVGREYTPNVDPIHADRQQLRQVFVNLFSNAADAMPHGGKLTIRLFMRPDPAHVVVEVSDTGTGVPPDILPRLSEPFFTTKPEGKGTGLGLPICRRIVQEHRGTLDIRSELGVGTTVRLALPVGGRTVTVSAE